MILICKVLNICVNVCRNVYFNPAAGDPQDLLGLVDHIFIKIRLLGKLRLLGKFRFLGKLRFVGRFRFLGRLLLLRRRSFG